jgi:mannose-1-phosphate guanylyltransferase
VKLICGEERPKQFCPLFGGRTLLAQTLRRAELTIPREHLLVSVAEHHRKWYLREAGLPTDQLIVQPTNKGTAPAVLHSVLSIAQIDENALVAILPSDHHYLDESLFADALDAAFIRASKSPRAIVLLGAQPDYPETEYGWIELGEPLHQQDELFGVRSFREKPPLEIARGLLLSQDAVWNTFVMVGRVGAFLEMLHSALPELSTELATATLWKGRETHIEHSIYTRMPSTDLSKQVLSTETKRLMVLRLGDVGWSDLGDPGRVLATYKSDSTPEWVAEWRRASGAEAMA